MPYGDALCMMYVVCIMVYVASRIMCRALFIVCVVWYVMHDVS